MTTTTGRLRCQRIGCDEFFSPDNNLENSCTYHSGPPLFHDGGKEWSCCKQRSHDFSDFLSLPGCTKGKHSSEKPVVKAAPSPNARLPQPINTGNSALDAAKAACIRCRQGFFCSDHGAQQPTAGVAKPVPATTVQTAASESSGIVKKAVPSKVFDINAKQVCKRKGCGNTFTEKDNHQEACNYHPGPAVFHDRLRGWKCCDVHVKEFDEFLEIPPCAKGWHDANPQDAA
uniref:CHORD domain-containing protein n=1 Tax=Physcomitrium patens TaxID=3218 RepID=A0A7I4AQG7_PHYPA|nr:cysteine and histidine-rich domain-containing protein RAR1-like [Physcomitrium patens]|eukprot:XP_024394893.1 cysteine and histidine-rich domain-containing protein RAR1-like [Physcomitrella patens]